jgi:hypothetical protein
MGVTTQDPALELHLDPAVGAKRLKIFEDRVRRSRGRL